MNTALSYLTGRRAWYVPGVSIWGDLNVEAVDMLLTETDDQQRRIVYLGFDIAGQSQSITFASLTDHRGNQLPATIDHPVIIPIARNTVGVALSGLPTSASFRIGRTAITNEDAITDLWIVEAGA